MIYAIASATSRRGGHCIIECSDGHWIEYVAGYRTVYPSTIGWRRIPPPLVVGGIIRMAAEDHAELVKFGRMPLTQEQLEVIGVIQ